MSPWPSVELGTIADVAMGQSPPGYTYNDDNDGLPFFQGKADFGHQFPVVRKWCSQPQRVAEAGDVLLSVRAPVGPTNVAREPSCIGRGLAAIRARADRVEQEYLRLFFKYQEGALALRGQGSTFGAISRRDIERLEVPLPPPAEQRRIVAILDQADRLRRLRAEADAKADRILPALFRNMFGDPNRPTLPMAQLPDLVDCLDHKRIPVRESDRLGRTGDTPYYGANGLVGYIDEPIFDETLVLLAEDGGYWGPAEQSAYKIQGPSWVNNHAHVLRCKEGFDPDYIVWSLNLLDLRRFISGTTRGKLTQAGMNAVELPMADRCLQSTFGKYARSQMRLTVERRRVERGLRSGFANLLHSAFTGSLTSRWRKLHTQKLLVEIQRRASVVVEA